MLTWSNTFYSNSLYHDHTAIESLICAQTLGQFFEPLHTYHRGREGCLQHLPLRSKRMENSFMSFGKWSSKVSLPLVVAQIFMRILLTLTAHDRTSLLKLMDIRKTLQICRALKFHILGTGIAKLIDDSHSSRLDFAHCVWTLFYVYMDVERLIQWLKKLPQCLSTFQTCNCCVIMT